MMRFLELLEDIDAEQPDQGAKASPGASGSRVYFHVTTKQRLKDIQASGIEPNHKRRWKTGFGQMLGDRGKIYLMSDFSAAVRWAYKMQWEHYHGKAPEKSPYLILCVREDPANLAPDPHPENGLYGHSWFEKAGSIPPDAITKVIPLTHDLVKQVVNGGTAVMESLGSLYDPRRCLRALADKGWEETTTTGEFRHPEYPEYAIDLDIHNPQGGPFTVFRGSRRLAVTRVPPTAQMLALKDRLI